MKKMDTRGGTNDCKQVLNCLMSFVSTHSTSEVFSAYWEIPAEAKTQQSGNGLKVLGMIYLKRVKEAARRIQVSHRRLKVTWIEDVIQPSVTYWIPRNENLGIRVYG